MSKSKMPRSQILGSRLRAARVGAGMSARAAATALNWHHVTLCDMETGKRNVRALELVELAQLYGCRILSLLEGL